MRRNDANGGPLFFSFTNLPVNQNPSNLSTQVFPLYCNKANDPVFLSIPIPITDPDTTYSDTNQIVFRVRDADGNVPEFQEIFFLFRCITARDPGTYFTTSGGYKKFAEAIANIG